MSGILRGGFTVSALLVVAWFVGQAMVERHVDPHTHNLIGVVIAAAVLVGGGTMFAIRNRRRG